MKKNFIQLLLVVALSTTFAFPQKNAHAMFFSSRENVVFSVMALLFGAGAFVNAIDLAQHHKTEELIASSFVAFLCIIFLDQSNQMEGLSFRPIDDSTATLARLTLREQLAYNQSITELNAVSEQVSLELNQLDLNQNSQHDLAVAAAVWTKALASVDSDSRTALKKLLLSPHYF